MRVSNMEESLDNNLELNVDDLVTTPYQSFKEDENNSNANAAIEVLETDSRIENISNTLDHRQVAVRVNENNDIECLPGYRFNPFDHELLVHYLWKKVRNEPLPHNKIVEIELYKYNPEEITQVEQELVDKEWYFFTPRDRKYKNGKRPNRAAGNGYWKATGADKDVNYRGSLVGHRKTLVFYHGKAPKGDKTDWIMHEYRVKEEQSRVRNGDNDMRLDDWVLCRIYKKDDRVRRAPKHNHTESSIDNSVDVSSPSNQYAATATRNDINEAAGSNFCNEIRPNCLPPTLSAAATRNDINEAARSNFCNEIRPNSLPPTLSDRGPQFMLGNNHGNIVGTHPPLMMNTSSHYIYPDSFMHTPLFPNPITYSNLNSQSFRYIPQPFASFTHENYVENTFEYWNAASHSIVDNAFLDGPSNRPARMPNNTNLHTLPNNPQNSSIFRGNNSERDSPSNDNSSK